VGIDRTLRTKAQSVLFAEESIDCWAGSDGMRCTTLFGVIETDEQGRASLQKLLEATEGYVHIGASRTRGLGETKMQIGSVLRTDSVSEWLERGLEAAKILTTLDRSWQADQDMLLALHFPAGAVFCDKYLRGTNDPSSVMPWLPRLSGRRWSDDGGDGAMSIYDAKVRTVYADAELVLVRGWNAAHGLPRTDDVALRPGSIVAYQVRGTQAAMTDVLRRLEADIQGGVGLRRNEGFGRVVVNDVLHLELSLDSGISSRVGTPNSDMAGGAR
jgi:hypothetical protein